MENNELKKLKEYNDSTSINSIMMPTKREFDIKIKLAKKLWPQISETGEINYLLGKGAGVELALLGEVQNRKKNNCNFPYRSHSDFEIYDTLGNYSQEFLTVFGAQEIYPKTRTKGLDYIPDGYMDQTYDTVIYDGESYLIPELELLFLDKYMRQEATPREEGCDAMLLLREYKLDINKINDYFERFVRKPNLDSYYKNRIGIYDRQIAKLNKLYSYAEDLLAEDNVTTTFENVSTMANIYIDRFRNQGAIVNGITVAVCPEKIEYVRKADGIEISDENKEEIRNLIVEDRLNTERKYSSIIKEINDSYQQIYSPAIKK